MKNLEKYFGCLMEYHNDYKAYRRYEITVNVPYDDIPEDIWKRKCKPDQNTRIIEWLLSDADSDVKKEETSNG